MSTPKRKPKIVVMSDLHLGTIGCHAREIREYLKSIEPEILILNGDIIDIWNFRKRYFPKEHLKVLRKIMDMASDGVKVYYLTGNHDELLRRFTDYKAGGIHLKNKLVLNLDGENAWFFHGDVFDVSIQNAKWVAKLGGWGYDSLIWLNRATNVLLDKFGFEPYSLSKKIKNSVKEAVRFINDFENTAAELAIDNGYAYVVCGHIHQPQMRRVVNKKGTTLYLNSGDWVENLTALEFDNQRWTIYNHPRTKNKNAENEDWQDITTESLIAGLLTSEIDA